MGGFHENKLHGMADFPYIVYRVRLPEFFRSYPMHWHEEMEWILVICGQGIVTVGADRYEARTGDILAIPPQMLHGIEQQDGREMEYFNILCRLTLLERETGPDQTLRQLYDPTLPLNPYLPHGSPQNALLQEHLQDLVNNRKRQDEAYTLMIRSHLLAVVYHMLEGVQVSSPSPTLRYDSLKPALEAVWKHCEQELSTACAAALCGFSASHFRKLFRELTGTSFSQYRKRLRLERAEALLRSGTRVGEAAEKVGFHNLSYFTRAFQDQYGHSPSQHK